MSKPEIFSRWTEHKSIPAPSRVAHEVMQLCRGGMTPLGEIASYIESDPHLSSYLLEYINSSVAPPDDHILSIHSATEKLGIETITFLVPAFSILSRTKNGACSQFNYQVFWAQSLARAVATHSLAQQTGQISPDEHFACSLLADIGRLVLASVFPDEYGNLLSAQLDRATMLHREAGQFGLNHRQVSSAYFQFWGLPEACAPASYFSSLQPDTVNSVGDKNDSLFVFAETISQICMLEMPLKEKIIAAEESAADLGLKDDFFADLFDDIVKKWQRWGYVFKISTRDCPSFRTLKETEYAASLSADRAFDKDALKILVTDDDPMTLLSLSRLLNTSGKTVFTADNGENGLTMALEKKPHMLITDWRMPKMNGIELCRALRDNELTRHIYIIMLTGKESDDELVQALEAGADDFMVKPFTPKVLEARIRSGERIIGYQQMIHHDREVIQQYADLLSSANLKLQNMAMTDVLTDLPNRRSALNRLKEVVSEAQRHREPLCCIMIDIDHFKQVNDRHGHDVGDKVLREIAGIFSTSARSYDMVSRIGGEEFLVICARSSLSDTGQLAERLRSAVELHRVLHDDIPIQTTISLGVAAWHEGMADGEEMTRAADIALYQAKQLGRNRVIINELPG